MSGNIYGFIDPEEGPYWVDEEWIEENGYPDDEELED